MRTLLCFLFLSFGTVWSDEVSETRKISEKYGYAAEVRLPDETRCDLVSDTHAIEVEWANKWKEAPAQAVLYGCWLSKKPAIILLTRNQREDKIHILRCKLVCEKLQIAMEVWQVDGE